MKYCTKCGEKNPDEAKFCSKCGNPFVMEEHMNLEARKEGGLFPKHANITLGVLLAICAFMTFGFLTLSSEAHDFYQRTRSSDRTYIYEMEYYVMLIYTIGAFLSGALLGYLWYSKKKSIFYVYIVVTIVANLIAVFTAASVSSSTAEGSLYPLGVLIATIICLFIKVKGRSVYELLQ